jgi:hypothetical protein
MDYCIKVLADSATGVSGDMERAAMRPQRSQGANRSRSQRASTRR